MANPSPQSAATGRAEYDEQLLFNFYDVFYKLLLHHLSGLAPEREHAPALQAILETNELAFEQFRLVRNQKHFMALYEQYVLLQTVLHAKIKRRVE